MDKGSGEEWRLRPPGARARQQRTVDAEPQGPQWPTTMMAVGLLLFIVLFWTIGHLTFISYTDLFRWLALFAFSGNLLPRRWVEKRFAMDRLEWFWFNLLAVGPMIFCGCLLLNFFVHGPEQEILVPGGRGFNLHAYWQEHRELPPHVPLLSDLEDPAQFRAAIDRAGRNDVVYGIARGSFGYVVITSHTEVRELRLP